MTEQILNIKGNTITDQDVEDILAESGEKFINHGYGFENFLRNPKSYTGGVFEWTEHGNGYRFFILLNASRTQVRKVEGVTYPLDRQDDDLSAFVEKMNAILSR